MKLYSVVVILVLATNCRAQEGHYIDPEKLSWDDYTGFCPPNAQSTAQTQSKYVTHFDTSGIRISNIKVWVEFIPSLSWVNWNVLNSYILLYKENLFKHEKLHYLTIILLAKRMKMDIANQKISTRTQLSMLIRQYINKYTQMANEYDSDTKHGEDYSRQQFWNTRIMNELEALKNISLDIPRS